MKNIILFIIIMIVLSAMILFLQWRATKKIKDLYEMIFGNIVIILCCVILFVFLLDKYNIPTELGWNVNVDTQNWLAFLGEYITGIVGVIIGALIAIWTTKEQIKCNDEVNQENLRIQNMPLLKYDCIKDKKTDIRLKQLDTIFNNDEGVTQSLNISLKNIGLNTIRRTYLIVKCDILEKEYYFDLDNQGIMEKDQEVIIPFVLRLKTNRTYNFKITIYYKDLLFNVYEQKILLNYELFSVNDGLNNYFNSKFNVKSENKIDELPQIEFEEIY